MKNQHFFGGVAFAVLTGSVMVLILLAVELFILLLLGFTYESWQALVLFIVGYGIAVYIGSYVLKRVIERKRLKRAHLHTFWLQSMTNFVLLMLFVTVMDGIWISIGGALAYTIITSAITGVFEYKAQQKM